MTYHTLITVLDRVYGGLLWLYPSDFRREFGEMMRLDFHDQMQVMLSDQPAGALFSLWTRTFTDLIATSLAERLESRKDISMSTLPETIGQYQIQSELGGGTTARVYLARDPGTDCEVVLKVIYEYDEYATYKPYLEEEAKLWSELDHPSIPRIHDYVIADDKTYFAIDYVKGATMLDLINKRDKALPESVAIQWGIEICDFLTYLHTYRSEPILYRDMKPGNIMMADDNHIRMIDFGIARRMIPGQSEAEWEGIGTVGYAPPEQYAGRVSVASDIYAVGATLYHLVTGRDPREPDRQFLFHIYPPHDYNPDLSIEFEQVILKATEFKPKDRFQSAQEMKTALIACLK